MRKTKFEIAKPLITTYFNGLPIKIFKPKEIFAHLSKKKGDWELAKSTTASVFIKFLIEKSQLKQLDFPFPYRHEVRFVWGEVPLLEVLLTLYKDCYFTHYTAMYFHGLTENEPDTIYLNHEQAPRPQNALLDQKSIDMAFRNHQRQSQNRIEFGDIAICSVNGMSTNQLGVVSKIVTLGSYLKAEIRTTNLERTLIDIAVRPAYSGGVDAVKAAYTAMRDQAKVSVLLDTLTKLRYVYPYHQVIGYYLENAGYPSKQVDLFRQIPRDYDFYLTHQIKNRRYIKEWKLYVSDN